MIVESIRVVIFIASLLLMTGGACVADLTLAERLGYSKQAKLLIVHADDSSSRSPPPTYRLQRTRSDLKC